MAGTKPVDYLEQLQVQHPELAEDVADMASLYQRKLWHQLTLKLESAYSKPEFNRGDLPLQLYTNFVSDFGYKINLLKLAQFVVHVSKHIKDPAESLAFLQSVTTKLQEMKLPRSDQPLLFLRMHVAQQQLEAGQVAECKVALEAGREQLDRLTDVDPCVSAAVYYVSSLYHKLRHEYADFYRSSMLYLAFVSSDQLPYDFKLPLAVDVGLSALLGDGIYGFAQLLQHPIVVVLRGSPFEWLAELLDCFQAGDLARYDELCARHAAVLNAQPALVEHERLLREKVTISALLGLVSELPPESRRIPLERIAAATQLSVDGAEFLVMKALALHLVEGSIDQVAGDVSLTWVQPRVLTKPQLQGLKQRLDDWLSKVSATAATLEAEGVGVVQA